MTRYNYLYPIDTHVQISESNLPHTSGACEEIPRQAGVGYSLDSIWRTSCLRRQQQTGCREAAIPDSA